VQLRSYLEEKSSGSGLESREYGNIDPPRWPCRALYPQKLALTSLTSGDRSVGIVCSRTQATEFLLFLFCFILSYAMGNAALLKHSSFFTTFPVSLSHCNEFCLFTFTQNLLLIFTNLKVFTHWNTGLIVMRNDVTYKLNINFRNVKSLQIYTCSKYFLTFCPAATVVCRHTSISPADVL
jgi:hypothetical protein